MVQMVGKPFLATFHFYTHLLFLSINTPKKEENSADAQMKLGDCIFAV